MLFPLGPGITIVLSVPSCWSPPLPFTIIIMGPFNNPFEVRGGHFTKCLHRTTSGASVLSVLNPWLAIGQA